LLFITQKGKTSLKTISTSKQEQRAKTLEKSPVTQTLGWTLLWVALSGAGLGLLSLLYAIGPYERQIWISYFHHPLILLLNILPVVILSFLFYCLYGAARPAFITTAVIVMGLTLGDYYLLKFRDDPLMFEDILNLKEALAITAAQKYDLSPDRRMLFGAVCILLGILFLSLLVKRRLTLSFRRRLVLALIPAAVLGLVYLLCSDDNIYEFKTQNYEAINRWSSTQVYISKGFVYPFFHSISADKIEKPEGYRASDAQEILRGYESQDIPADKQVSVVTIQLEAFADFSDSGVPGVDWERAYETYHGILEESYHGRLIDNVFAGGTVKTERTFLTGFVEVENFRKSVNSYAWYFSEQGYTVLGSHPCYQWFYNRKNVNTYLGLPTYYFFENRYQELAGSIAKDEILMPDIFQLYQKAAADGTPVFSFNVTYQGHGPYDTESNQWGVTYTDGRYSTETTNIVDNYLGSIQDTAENLRVLLDQFAALEEPVVVVIYGDHRPWLGDGNSAYTELGVDMDTSGTQGLYNKYSTDYIIWANEAAKAVIGNSFTGQGQDISPNFLMNQLFSLCGWKGNAYIQAAEEIWQQMPVITTIGRFCWEDRYYREAELPEEAKSTLQKFRCIQYYWEHNFQG